MAADPREHFSPATTALIVVGASKFRYPGIPPETEAFRHSRDGILEYFKDPAFGFGLSDNMIYQEFDTDRSEKQVRDNINRFISEQTVKDLFIFVTSHGFVPDPNRMKYLHIALPASTDPDTCLNFKFFEQDLECENARVYCIVDCCSSGEIHPHIETPRVPREAAYRVSAPDASDWPKGGKTFLTSNNQARRGAVVADDHLPGIKATLFTHVLLKVLRNGVPGKWAAGFGIADLCKEIQDELPNAVKRVNEEIREKKLERDPLPAISSASADFPEYSDDPKLGDKQILVSALGVFQNNHYRHVDLLHDAGEQLEAQAARLTTANLELREQVEGLHAAGRDLEGRIEGLHAANGKLEERLEAGSAAGKDLQTRVDDLNTGRHDLEQRIEALHAVGGKLEERIAKQSAAAAEFEERVHNLNTGTRELEDRAAAQLALGGELQDRIQGLNADNQKLEARVQDLNAGKRELDDRVSELHAERAALRAKADSLSTENEGLAEELEAAAARNRELEARAEDLAESQEKLGADLKAVRARYSMVVTVFAACSVVFAYVWLLTRT